MFRRLMPLVLCAVLVGGATTALGVGETVVAYGTGQIAVTPTNPKNEASIQAAVADAQLKATPAAIADAKVTAQAIADAASLTLGPIFSVAQQNNVFFYGPFGGSTRVAGPFNGNFCGTVTRAITKRVKVNGKVRTKVVRRVKERKCFPPPFVVTTLEVTFQATPKV